MRVGMGAVVNSPRPSEPFLLSPHAYTEEVPSGFWVRARTWSLPQAKLRTVEAPSQEILRGVLTTRRLLWEEEEDDEAPEGSTAGASASGRGWESTEDKSPAGVEGLSREAEDDAGAAAGSEPWPVLRCPHENSSPRSVRMKVAPEQWKA